MLQAYCEVLCIVYAEAFFELAVMIIKSLWLHFHALRVDFVNFLTYFGK